MRSFDVLVGEVFLHGIEGLLDVNLPAKPFQSQSARPQMSHLLKTLY